MRTISLCGETLPHAGHVCAFFDSRDQKYDVLIPFFKDAILAGDEIVNIVDAADRSAHLESLLDGGVPIRAAMDNGQLSVFTSEETYLQDDDDTLPKLLEFLKETLSTAKAENRSLRTCGEMNWIHRSTLPVEEILTYEARVNDLVPDFECTLMCIYDTASLSSSMMLDILATHPAAIINGRLRKNPNYVQPAEFLEMLRARTGASN